jgi:hypothetical protein
VVFSHCGWLRGELLMLLSLRVQLSALIFVFF